MLHSHHPERPAYVVDAGTLCRGILAFCRRAVPAGKIDPAAALLDAWLGDEAPQFEWVHSEETLVVYEAVLRRLELSNRFVDRVIGTIRQLGTRAVPPQGAGDYAGTIEEVFCAAAGAVDKAAIVTSDPARFPETCRIRTLSPAEAVADVNVHAGYAERAAGLLSPESTGDPAVQGWPA